MLKLSEEFGSEIVKITKKIYSPQHIARNSNRVSLQLNDYGESATFSGTKFGFSDKYQQISPSFYKYLEVDEMPLSHYPLKIEVDMSDPSCVLLYPSKPYFAPFPNHFVTEELKEVLSAIMREERAESHTFYLQRSIHNPESIEIHRESPSVDTNNILSSYRSKLIDPGICPQMDIAVVCYRAKMSFSISLD